jgi:hypothetical protein
MDGMNQETLQYVGTLREQLEQLTEERTPEGLPRSINSFLFPFHFFASALSSL